MARSRSLQTRRSTHVLRLLVPALIGALLSACAAAPTAIVQKSPAKVEMIDGSIGRITLDAKTAERIGIKTAPVGTVAGERVMPHGALVYDTKGDAYTYISPRPLVFERFGVRVKSIRGDQVVLADGPQAGVSVVSVGASQLLGIELGIGS